MPNHMKSNSVSLPGWYFFGLKPPFIENAVNQMH